ncbi:MAG TPA: ABC transporter permease [Bryobacteraceae bacterium]|nr:ABC transporter permease [Bryobacteraceae bacterium]
MTTLGRDLAYAVRMLLTAPVFSTIAALTLALGIGANTVLFSVVNGVLLNPLAYPRSGELMAVSETRPGDHHSPIEYPNFLDWQRETRTFASMAIYRNQDYNVSGRAEAQRLSGYMVSGDFFSTLDVQPSLGRTFRPDDDVQGAAPVVILGGGYWQREFGGSADAIGKSLTLNGSSYRIVGVIPANFTFYGQDRDVYTAIGQWKDPSFRDRRISVSARAFGRLKPGVTREQAQADMDSVARHLAAEFPVADKGVGIALAPMKEDIVGNIRPLLIVLLAAVGFLLLIACANVANLLLARTSARSREFAVRAALGAGQGRIVRQLLTESVLLAGLGGVLGLGFAIGAIKIAVQTLPGTLPRAEEIALDGRVLVFTMGLTLACAVIFGLAPALKSSRTDLQEILKESGRGASGARHRMQRIFVAAEVALALVLLIGAGLMLRSLSALWRVDQGFNPSHAITFSLSMPSSAATTPAETRARLRQFDEMVQSIPGVQAVSVTLGSRPMIHDSSLPLWIEGRPKPANDSEMPGALFYLVEEGFEKAMGITLLRGRFVAARDDEHSPIVIDIDDVFARMYFPNEDPIGKSVNLTQFMVRAQIVGVVRHVKQWGPGADASSALQAQFFYPFMQMPDQLMRLAAGGAAVVIRTERDPAAILKVVRAGVARIDSREVIYAVRTMDDVVAGALAPRRISMVLLSVFANLALVLAGTGIYGVISYVVGQRTREIGLRMALGAQSGDVMRMVIGDGARMVLTGVGVGIAGALGLTRLMENELFGVSGHDPLTFGGVVLVLTLGALAACYIPARRAVLVDPVVALRCE